MAQSVGILNGTNVKIFIGGTAITGITANNLALAVNMREATTKDSQGEEEVLPGVSSATMGVDFFVAEDAAFPYANLFNEYKNKSKLVFRYSAEISGDNYYRGSCFLESLDRDDPLEDNVSASATFHVTAGVRQRILT